VSSRRAVWVPFLGRPASTSPALSLAAWKTGAPVYLVLSVRRNEQLHMVVEGPVDVPRTGTRAEWVRAHVTELSRILESYVRQYPEQWLWLHRRWKAAATHAPLTAQSETAAV
jgi:KDO2-lipid IV(A) lauroyltransferase